MLKLNSELDINYGSLNPSIDTVFLIKYGKICILSGIYVITQDLVVGMYGMCNLSFKPARSTDISIVVANSPSQSVAGGYISNDGDVFFQATNTISTGTELRISGVYISK